jgi:taurine dioxygenase
MASVIESNTSAITLHPLTGALGAEVKGVDLSAPLDEAAFAAVRKAFLDHIVLLFRDQSITPAQQIAFTARFGPVEGHPLASRRGIDGHPEILVLENQPGRPGARNDFWHSDISFAERPPLGSVLYGITIPEGRGDTMFCNMTAAYDNLSDGMRRMLDGLHALHNGAGLAARNNAGDNDGLPITNVPPPVAHPVVRTHPDTGRKALYINPYFTTRFADMTAEESRPLIDMLTAHATRPENVYRHRWQAGDVLMWDNRAAMHYAVRDYDESMPRLMHRATAAGDRPV